MKQLLMDQKFISGLGQHLLRRGAVRGRPATTTACRTRLSSQEVRRLYRAMQEILQDAIRFRGTTLEDEAYVDLFGKPGEFRRAEGLRPRRVAVPPVPHADPDA